MRILISGAGGQIGSALVTDLIRDNFEIYTLGRTEIEGTHKHFNWTLGMSPSSESLEGVDWIVHLAWDSSARESGNYHLNIGGTKLLLESARLANVPVVIISSYSCFNPVSGYGKAKVDIEVLNHHGINLRVGKIVNRRSDLKTAQMKFKSYPLVPSPNNVNVHVIFLDELVVSIRSLLKSRQVPQTIVIPSYTYSFKAYLEEFHCVKSFEIPNTIFDWCIRILEKTRIPLLKRLADQWKSVYSTSRVL
jgi:hypothetical protein